MTLFAPNAELEILVALLIHGREAAIIVRSAGVVPEALSPEHRGPFRVLLSLADAGDPPTMTAVRQHALAVGEARLAERVEEWAEPLIFSVAILGDLGYYADLVVQHWRRRLVVAASEQLVVAANDWSTPLITSVSSSVTQLVTHAEAGVPRHGDGDGITDAILDLERESRSAGEPAGLSTGLRSLDDILDGLCNDRLIVLAARPGCGKTSFGLWCAQHAAESEAEVYFVTLEQPVRQLQRRRLGMVMNEDLRALTRHQGMYEREAARVHEAAQRMRTQSLTFDDRANTVTSIGLAVQRHSAAVRKVDLLVVDYLSLVRIEGQHDRHDLGVGNTAQKFASLAKTLHCPLLLLVQLNRESTREGKPRRPRDTDLRDSGGIEQAADQIVMMWQPERDGVERLPGSESLQAEIEFVVPKNRHGRQGLVRASWYKPTFRYTEQDRFPFRVSA